MEVESKVCPGCKADKPASAFSMDRKRKDGLQIECKACNRKRYLKTRDAQIAYKRGYRAERVEKVKEWRNTAKERSKGRPDVVFKQKARQTYRTALLNGTLVRPDSCSECGIEGKIEGHHPDYAKPLEVVWLCRNCHAAAHRTAGLEAVA